MTIEVDSWMAAGFALAFIIPSFLISIGAGIGVFILAERALRRVVIRWRRSLRK